MAKKKKQKSSESSSEPSSSAAASSSEPAPALTVTSDAEAARMQRAFDLGNFSATRALIAAAQSDGAKAVGARLLPRMNIEREQVIVGLVGVVVVVTACVLVLTRG